MIITAEPNRVRKLARRLHAKVATIGQSFTAQDVNVLEILRASPTTARLRFIGPTSPGSAVRLTFSGNPKLLLRRWPFRFHYFVR